MLKLMLGWTVLLLLIVFAARKLWHAPQPSSAPTPAAESIVLTDEDMSILQTAGQACSQAFQGFITAGSPEMRNQFVLSPVTTAARMERFYNMNPLVDIKPELLQLAGSGILRLPGGERAFEARWMAGDGRIYDAVFRSENDEWRLDWDHFVRYSDYPWALFIAGSGPEEGEFRLLARERLAEERKDQPTISLMLYAPRFGSPREPGFQSPEFLVPRSERAGQLLDAAFKLAREGGRLFDSGLEEINPDGMIRVRVKVRRFEEELERKFEITEVLACHWQALDDPGVEPLVSEAPVPAEESSE